ncbi:MAG: mevalonate kinase family protein [Woeseiaceae bacterium]
MTGVLASAPGKVVLCGEYAVLDGAPAVCMAVNRRAKVEVTDSDGDWHRVTAPGYSSLEGRFVVDGAAVDWLQGAEEYRIVDAVWRAVASRSPARPGKGCLSIELDTRAFVDNASGEKIGIGSSAALAVALAAALSQSNEVRSDALRAHRLFQRSVGSGVDVATSASGGLVEYRMKDASVASLHWPEGLRYRLIWTGVPASTRTKLDKLQKTGHRASGTALASAAESMANAWHSALAVMSQYPAYIEALWQFSVDHDLGIFDAGHDKLVSEAAAAGLVYKPCGAGGGDIGVLLGTSDKQLDDFLIGKDASGCQVLVCELEPDGILLEQC